MTQDIGYTEKVTARTVTKVIVAKIAQNIRKAWLKAKCFKLNFVLCHQFPYIKIPLM